MALLLSAFFLAFVLFEIYWFKFSYKDLMGRPPGYKTVSSILLVTAAITLVVVVVAFVYSGEFLAVFSIIVFCFVAHVRVDRWSRRREINTIKEGIKKHGPSLARKSDEDLSSEELKALLWISEGIHGNMDLVDKYVKCDSQEIVMNSAAWRFTVGKASQHWTEGELHRLASNVMDLRTIEAARDFSS